MTATSAGVAVGLAMSTKRSKNVPVAPSARNQRVAVSAMPALAWPAPKVLPPEFRYIARSATTGPLARMAAETSVQPRRESSLLTQTFIRLCGPTEYRFVKGVRFGRRYVTSTSTGAAPGFWNR